MQTSDSPTNPRTRRVLKNRQVHSGSFRSKDAGALGKQSSSSLVFQYLYNIKINIFSTFYVIPPRLNVIRF